eukprot:6401791-Amphidinium_carterae.1
MACGKVGAGVENAQLATRLKLLLPTIRHCDTICGYPLPGWHISPEHAAEDGVTLADSQLYSLALRVLPMGDQKAMEVAQM